MVLRPTRPALLKLAVRWSLMLVPGALLVYAGWSSGVIVPALVGAPAVLLALFAFTNVAVARIRLQSGVLSGRTLLGRVEVPVNEITKIVPVNLGYRGTRGAWIPWNRPVRAFDVCTTRGPTGLWLNPNLYGEPAIQRLLDEIHVQPEARAEDRFLDAFSRNREYGKRPSP